jgi:hypothetical protein
VGRWVGSFAIILSLGCIPFGGGTGTAHGPLQVPNCQHTAAGVFEAKTFPPERPFDLAPTWFFGERRGDVLQIRMQRDARGLNETDALVLDVRSAERVERDVQAGPVTLEVRPDLEPDVGPAAPARMALVLKASCPDFTTSLLGRGTITFGRFQPRDDGHVEATFDVSLVDGQSARTTGVEIVRGQLSGSLRMQLHLVAEPG